MVGSAAGRGLGQSSGDITLVKVRTEVKSLQGALIAFAPQAFRSCVRQQPPTTKWNASDSRGVWPPADFLSFPNLPPRHARSSRWSCPQWPAARQDRTWLLYGPSQATFPDRFRRDVLVANQSIAAQRGGGLAFATLSHRGSHLSCQPCPHIHQAPCATAIAKIARSENLLRPCCFTTHHGYLNICINVT